MAGEMKAWHHLESVKEAEENAAKINESGEKKAAKKRRREISVMKSENVSIVKKA